MIKKLFLTLCALMGAALMVAPSNQTTAQTNGNTKLSCDSKEMTCNTGCNNARNGNALGNLLGTAITNGKGGYQRFDYQSCISKCRNSANMCFKRENDAAAAKAFQTEQSSFAAQVAGRNADALVACEGGSNSDIQATPRSIKIWKGQSSSIFELEGVYYSRGSSHAVIYFKKGIWNYTLDRANGTLTIRGDNVGGDLVVSCKKVDQASMQF